LAGSDQWLFQNDVCKFESYMPSEPVQSLRCYFLLQRPLSLRFAATGAGNPALREAGRKSMRNCGR
jgi:hypothetical protein